MGDLGLIPGLGRSPGEGNSYPFQYCGLENSTDCIVHGVEKSWIRLSDFHFTSLQYSCLKNPMDRGAWWATVHRDLKESDMPEWLSTCPQIFISLILLLFWTRIAHIFECLILSHCFKITCFFSHTVSSLHSIWIIPVDHSSVLLIFS